MNTPQYKNAGVDVQAGEALVDRIKKYGSAVGGFSHGAEIPGNYRRPVVVTGADGVGTKLIMAKNTGHLSTIGVDLVAMSANDVLCTGAAPWMFLDYFATGELDVDQADLVIRGVSVGCALAGCDLVGGETAEMPGLYHPGDFDLAGFCIGLAEKGNMIPQGPVGRHDKLVAIPSCGPHSNGFSLIRKLPWQGKDKIIDALMAPTRIYTDEIATAMKVGGINGAAHITGGGIDSNIQRALPDKYVPWVDFLSWQIPEVFEWIKREGGMTYEEAGRVFNMGLGMVLVVDSEHVKDVLDAIPGSWDCGAITEASFP